MARHCQLEGPSNTPQLLLFSYGTALAVKTASQNRVRDFELFHHAHVHESKHPIQIVSTKHTMSVVEGQRLDASAQSVFDAPPQNLICCVIEIPATY